MAKVGYVLEMTIVAGKLDEFKALAEGFIGPTKAEEPGTLTYQWYISEDGSRALLHEVFADSAAMLNHLGRVGPTLGPLMAIAPITRFEVIGMVSADAKSALADFGAVHFPHFAGFQR